MWTHETDYEFDKGNNEGKLLAGKSKNKNTGEEVKWAVHTNDEYGDIQVISEKSDSDFKEILAKHVKAKRLPNLFT